MSSQPEPSLRSQRLASAQRSLLLVVDVQEKLLPIMPNGQHFLWNVQRLWRAADLLGVQRLVTEQYPERLGATVAELNVAPQFVASKRMFSCRECVNQLQQLWETGARQAILCGLETHVCVLQTALDLESRGWQVFVVVDATSARSRLDHEVAINRLQSSGCTLITVEAVLFEWCETSLAPAFKSISQLVREPPPDLSTVQP